MLLFSQATRASRSPRFRLHSPKIRKKFRLFCRLMKTRLHKKIAHFSKVPAHTGLIISIAEKEKEDTESHKIDELYEFSNDSSLD